MTVLMLTARLPFGNRIHGSIPMAMVVLLTRVFLTALSPE